MTVLNDRNKQRISNDRKIRLKMTQKVMTGISNVVIVIESQYRESDFYDLG